MLYSFESVEPRDRAARFIVSRLGGRILETMMGAVSSRKPKESAVGVSKRDLWKELVSIALMQGLIFLAIASGAPWWTYIGFCCRPSFSTRAVCRVIRP